MLNVEESKMEVGTAWLQLNELGSNVQIKNITPAECIVLRKQFGVQLPGEAKPTNPISHLDISATPINRTKDDEYSRLVGKYGGVIKKDVFPGESPNIPATFKDAGFSATEEKAPKAGPEQVIVALSKLSKAETTDAQSVKEVEARKAAEAKVTELSTQLADLTSLVQRLMNKKEAESEPPQVEQSSTISNAAIEN